MTTTAAKLWRHESVKALVRTGKGKEPEEIIREKARSLVVRAKSRGWTGPPYKPDVLASLCGIRCEGSTALFTSEAQLTPLPNRQLLLEFNPDRPEGRRNFSICHEIAHTFFDDCYEIVHHRRSTPDDYDPESEVELLCQIAAAELLMPLDDFQSDMASLPMSLRSVPSMMERYAASREAVLRRMISVVGLPCAIVFLSKRLSNTERRKKNARPLIHDAFEPPKPKMRILYTVPHPALDRGLNNFPTSDWTKC